MTNIKDGIAPGRVTSIKKNAKAPVAASIPAQPASIHRSTFDAMPDSGFVRQAQLVPNPKKPGEAVPLPFSAPTLWRMVKAKTFPAPLKLSERVTAWRVGEVRAWMKAQVPS